MIVLDNIKMARRSGAIALGFLAAKRMRSFVA